MIDLSAVTEKKVCRDSAIDRLRGFAIVLMVADHVAIFLGPEILRETLTRASMPLFFLLAGHLVKRVSWRLIGVGVIGLFLPLYVEFIDDPNVLLWLCVFGICTAYVRKVPSLLPIGIVIALTVMANYFGTTPFGGYHPLALFALMLLGAMIPRESFWIGERLPRWFATLGRFSLSVYVVHTILIQVVTG